MTRHSRFLAPLILIVVTIVPSVHAFGFGGAWVREAKGYYIKAGFTSINAEDAYGFDGSSRPLFADTTKYANGSIGISNITFYGEYGVTDWLTGTISTYYSVLVREADIVEPGMEGLTESESASGLGDVWLGGRVRLLPDGSRVVGTATASVKIPTGSPNKEVPLGTGVVDYEGALAVGTWFALPGEERFGYVQASSGFRARNKAENEVNYLLEAGFDVIAGLSLQTRFDGVASFADFDAVSQQDAATIGMDEIVGSQSYDKFTLGLTYELTDYTEISLEGATSLAGKNSLNSNSFSVGIAWKQ
jgi:hypothetical protein